MALPGTVSAAKTLIGTRAFHSRLSSLEVMRAAASILVVFYHVQTIGTTLLGTKPFGGIFTGGRHGVDLFFVLSGFVIYYIHRADIGRAGSLWSYGYKRFVRIYPMLWIVSAGLVLMFLLGFGSASQAGAMSPSNLLASFLLLPQAAAPVLAVSWTLKYEIFFYLVFSSLILMPRGGMALFLLWQATALVSMCVTFHLSNTLLFYFRPICIEFGYGVASAMVIMNVRQRDISVSPRVLSGVLFASVALFAGLAYGDPTSSEPQGWTCLVYGAAAANMIIALVLLEEDGRFAVPKWLVTLGGASYAIYLVHYPFIRIITTLLVAIGHPPKGDFVFLAVALSAVILGVVSYLFVDRPTQRWLRHSKPLVRGAMAQVS